MKKNKLFDLSNREQVNIESISKNDIAIIGIAGQLPMASDVDTFWENLIGGVDCIRDFPDHRKKEVFDYFQSKGVSANADEVEFKKKAYLDSIDQFDYNFFGLSHKEACLMNPSQRLFLETTWHLFEASGYSPESLRGSNTGLFIGHASSNNYLNLIEEMEPEYVGMAYASNLPSVIGSRISYLLDFKGPSILFDTACSSSMTALHMACQSIKNGECEQAIVGGVNLSLIPIQEQGEGLGIISKHNKTRTFDDSSDGTVGGEGCLSIFIKPLAKAVDDKDKIWAVIKGSASNNDGASAGITAPNSRAQEEVLIKAWENAKIKPENISYIEAHGTGTTLGDPIEIEGLTRAFEKYTDKKQFCAIGSVKTNVGHLNSISGLAGIVKAALSLNYKQIPALLHFERPNRKIDFINSPVYVNDVLKNWDSDSDQKRLCGVSSFGLSGTNCHVVLEEAPLVKKTTTERSKFILPLSAKSEKALTDMLENFADYLSTTADNLQDICFTASTGRSHYNHRLAFTGKNKEEILSEINKVISDGLSNSSEYGTFNLLAVDKEEAKANDLSQARFNELSNEASQLIKEKDLSYENIADLFVKGADIEWYTLYKGEKTVKVSLPLYPYEKKRCWISYPEPAEHNNVTVVDQPVLSSPKPTKKKVSKRKGVLENLKGIISGIFEMSVEEVDTNTTFFEMGLDSISIIQVRQLVKNTYNLDIPIDRLFDDVSNLQSLADFIDENIVEDVEETVEVQETEFSADSGDGYIKNVIDQQLALMEKQLKLLSGGKDVEVGTKKVSKPALPAPKVEKRPVNKVENQPETDAYTESQLAYLKEFFKRYAEKTKSSKKKTQDTRSVYANNRNVAGYRSLFKEIMYPILADKAKGATITDVDNNEYVDFCLGFGVYLLGYNHPAVKEAIDYQNDQGVSLGAMSSIAGEVAQLIVEMTGVERVAFYNSGTEAIMVALRLARAARSRSKVVMFQGSYHGTYDGVLVQKDVFSANHKAAPKATGIPAKMLDDVVLLDYGTEESLQIIEEMAHDLAAVLVEPVQSRRPEFQPKEYLQKLRELTEDTGVPLIFDEIITGFRMHSGGTQALFDIKADLVTYGKIIGGGLPIGVVAGKAEFMHGVDAGGDWSYDDDSEPFFDHRKTFVAGTFCTHPLTMAASRAILRYLKEQGGAIQDKLNERTHKMATELNTFFERNDFEIEIVNFGSLFQIRTNYDLALVIYHLIERGIYAWEGMTFFISEAHSPEQVNFFIENFKSVIVELREKGFIPSKEGVEVNTTGKGSELERLELTIEQQQLVTFLNIEQNSNDAFKIFKNETIEDAFDEKAFNQAAQELANRHEILRAHHVDGDSLIFDKGENISIDVDDLDSSVESIEEWIGKKRNEQINVFEGPLVRFSILRVDQKSFVFTLTAHQIIVDGYSIQILLKEIGELYFTFLNGQKVELPVPARFSDYTTKLSNFLASEDGRETIAYWERELKDEVSNLVFPNNPYSDQPGKRRGESYELDLGVELTSKLKQVGKQSNVSLFMLLLGLYEVFVYKITNQKKFVIGTPVAGQLNFDFDYLVGQCALIIPSLVNVELELTSLEFLKKLKKQRVSTLKYQKVSYDALSHFLSETVKMPEIQAMFNLDSAINSGQIATGNEGPSIKTKDDISSKYDLFLNAIEVNNSLRLNFQIDHSKFDADLFKGWVNGFLGMINNLINQPHIIVTNLWNNQEAHSITTCEINLPLQNQYITDYQEEASQYFQEQSVVVKNDASQSVPNGVYGKVVCLNDSTFIESPYHGRLLQDGTLELLGKSEDLITLNGFACDRTVVEGIVNGLKGVEQSHIISLSTKDESTRSSYAVFVKGSEQNKLTLEAELKDALPLHLTPELIIPIEELPFDKNGNVLDDKLLAIAVGEREEARESDTIELLKDLFKEVLNQAHIKSDDNFFDLGGNSLKAVQLIARINKHFNKSIGIKDVFANPTVVKMDRIIESSEHADFSEIVRVEGKELHPVSHAQKRLWILDQFRDNKTAYLMPKSYLLTGKLDEEKFEETFKLLIARHESLNTVFVSVDGIPMQKINDSSNFHVTFEDLSADSKAENKFKTYAKEEAQTPFDLSAGPLVRAKLLKLEEEKFGFLFTIHHIVGDGWSMEILMRDFAEIYNGLVINGTNPLSPLPVQYKDYTHWLDGQLQNQLEIDKEFWHEKFSGDIPVINLPTDKKRPAFKTSNGAVVPFQLTKEAGEFIKNTSDKCKTSIYNTLLAATKVFLYKHTDETDLVIGTAVSGRSHHQLEDQVGLYADTLAIRTTFDKKDTFEQLLFKVQDSLLSSFTHQNYPFDLLVEELKVKRDPSRSPLFDIMVEIQDIDTGHTGEGIQLRDLQVENYFKEVQSSKYDLSIRFNNGDTIAGSIEYNTDLFDESTIKTFIDRLNLLLISLGENPTSALVDVDFLGKEEKKQILINSSGKESELNEEDTVISLFETAAIKSSDACAVKSGDQHFTYNDLNEKAQCLATQLINQYAVQNGDIVAILLDNSFESVVSILAILKTGAAFLPIDPSSTNQRVKFFLEDSNAKLLVTQTEYLFNVQEFYAGDLFAIDLQLEDTYDTEVLQSVDIAHENNAYVIYTSGSTGTPKGVIIKHKNLLNYINWANDFYFGNQGGYDFPLFTPISFDLTLTSIFLPLVKGDQLIIPSNKSIKNVLTKIFDGEYEIDAIKLTPSHISMLPYLNLKSTSIKKAIVGGEALYQSHLDILFDLNDEMTVYNEYGPTETTIGCTVKSFNKEDNTLVTIGKPIYNTQVYVLNKDLECVPNGTLGELYISGEGVAREYLNRSELTEERFLRNPFDSKKRVYKTGDLGRYLFDGEIEYLGRNDRQIKLRGHRIEPAEIENALHQTNMVESAFVHCIKQEGNNDVLVAYYTSGKKVSLETLKVHLSKTLASYMVPQYFVPLEELPMTSNGKIDVAKLPDISSIQESANSADYEKPSNELESKMVEVWQKVLNKPKVSVNDDFFALGGHSLKATQIISEIQSQLGLELDISDLFANPTIKLLSQAVDEQQESAVYAIEAIEEQDYYQLSRAQHRLWIQSEVNGSSSMFNTSSAFHITGDLNIEALKSAFKQIVKRHESLRTQFKVVDGEPIQCIIPDEFCDFDIEVIKIGEDIDLEEIVTAESRYVFDIESEMLIKVKLFEQRKDLFLLSITIHHLITDGWSQEIIMDEVTTIYKAELEHVPHGLEELKVHYRDYTSWLHNQDKADHMAECRTYWMDKFKGKLESVDLPIDFDRPAQSDLKGGTIKFEIPETLTRQLKAFSDKNRASLFMTLTSIINVLIYRLTWQKDIIVGTPIAGRNHKDLENQIGMFLNILALRNEVDIDKSFGHLVRQVKETTLEAFKYQLYPFDNLVEELDLRYEANRSALFDVGLTWQNQNEVRSNPVQEVQGVNIEPMVKKGEWALHELWFFGSEEENVLSFRLRYRLDLFKQETVEFIKDLFLEIVDKVCNDNQSVYKLAKSLKGLDNDTSQDLAKSSTEVISDEF